MASAGLLLLLLMSSSFVLSSLSTQLSSVRRDEHALQKRGKVQTAGEYIDKIHSVGFPVIGLIPVAGPYLNALLKAVGLIMKGNRDATKELIKTKFDELNIKIDKYHVEIKWNNWAPVYHDYETKINNAWNELQELSDVCKNTKIDQKEKQNHINLFKEDYKPTAIQKLYTTLTAGQPSFTTDFGKLLTDNVRCHEKSIIDYTLLINILFRKGTSASYIYYGLKGVNKVDELAKKAFKAASVMFDIHKHCIDNPDEYIKKDVKGLIDGSKDRTQLAKKVRMFLEKEYDRYDWIAVAFITTNSKHKTLTGLNKHVLEGFTNVSIGEVSVAVARQLKGQHTKADKVKKVIEECVKKSTDCHKVGEKLKSCNKNVDGTKLSETFTAVHAYIDKSHDSVDAKNAKEAPEDEYLDNPSSTPYVYKGKCKKYKFLPNGHYRVLIKSDEEIMKKDPCEKLQCGGPGKGKCVVLEKTKVPVCECEEDHYGVGCEESLEDYKKAMLDQPMPSA